MFDDFNPMSSHRVDKHTTWPIPSSCRRQHWFYPPEKARVLPSFGERQFAVYISAELSHRCLSSSLSVHMHSLLGPDNLCCQEIKLYCGKGCEGNSLRQISQFLTAFLPDVLAFILCSFSAAAAPCKMSWSQRFGGDMARAVAVKGKSLRLVPSSGDVLGFCLLEMLSSWNVGEINGSSSACLQLWPSMDRWFSKDVF